MPAPPTLPPVEPADDTVDIFGRPSGWMLYWGSAGIVIFFGLLLLFMAWVDYPDKVVTPVTIITKTPPVPAVTRTEGVVATIFVEEGQAVTSGDPLLMLENPAVLDHVRQLDQALVELSAYTTPLDLLALPLPSQLQLGTMGRNYTELINLSTEIKYWLQKQTSGQRLGQLEEQIRELQKRQASLQEQLETQQLETAIAKNQLEQYQELFRKESASQLEVDQAATDYLRTQRLEKEQENRISESRGRAAALRESSMALREAVNDQLMDRWLTWQATLRHLQQDRQEWQAKYLLLASQNGRVSFYQNLYPGLFLPAHEVVMGIVPPASSAIEYRAEGKLPQTASGKILPGSRAYLEVEAFPVREYGQVAAQVEQIALATAADEEGYRLVLILPDGLTTSYGIALPARQQLRAQAVLLSEEKSLLSRLLDHLRAARKNR